jgi:ABC-type multidrug transport system fused ATPase/permease subunit
MVTDGVVTLLGDAFLLVTIAVVLIALDVKLALVTFIALPVVGVLTILVRTRMRRSFREMRTAIARVNAFLNEHLSGMSTDQLFTAEGRALADFDELNQEYRRASLGALVASSIFQPLVALTRTWTSAVLFLAGGFWILAGQLTIGTLLAFWQLIDRFFEPVEDLSDKYTIFQAAMASAERVFRLLDTPATVTDPSDPVVLDRVRGAITFDHVWFAYDDDDWVLRDVDIAIEAGERVAVVGATGAGKTSIISLLSRFYDVQRGRILLDGVDIRSVRQADLRSHIGVVLQDPFIFAGTIASNIRLRDDTIDDERVRAAARFVNADKFIEQLPNGYDTIVQERGSTLSVGQKQLLAFARAIAFNPEIILVLDEATSSIDSETERLIQDALRKLMTNRTSIVIAHRLSTIRDVDRIIVLSKGRVVESGSHRRLMAKRGAYRRLYELQYRTAE